MFTQSTQLNYLPRLSLESCRPDDAAEDVEYRLTIPLGIRIFGPLQLFFALMSSVFIAGRLAGQGIRVWPEAAASAALAAALVFLYCFLLRGKTLRLEKLRDGPCRMVLPLGRAKIFDFSDLAAMEINEETEFFTTRTLYAITDKREKKEFVVMTGLFHTIKPELGELMLSFVASAWQDALSSQQSQDCRAEMEKHTAGRAFGLKTNAAVLDAINITSDAVAAPAVDTGEATEAVPSAGHDLETLAADLGGSCAAPGSSVDGTHHLRLPVYFPWGKAISALAAASTYMVYYYCLSRVESNAVTGTLGVMSIGVAVGAAAILLRRLSRGGYAMNMDVSGYCLDAAMDGAFSEKRAEISDYSSITALFPYDNRFYIVQDAGDGFGARLIPFIPFRDWGCGLEPDAIKAVTLFLGRLAPDMVAITDPDVILEQLRRFGVPIELAN